MKITHGLTNKLKNMAKKRRGIKLLIPQDNKRIVLSKGRFVFVYSIRDSRFITKEELNRLSEDEKKWCLSTDAINKENAYRKIAEALSKIISSNFALEQDVKSDQQVDQGTEEVEEQREEVKENS